MLDMMFGGFGVLWTSSERTVLERSLGVSRGIDIFVDHAK